jgi:hypothetical protein
MIVGCRVYQRSKIPAMVSQHRDGPQKEWKMVNGPRVGRVFPYSVYIDSNHRDSRV